MKKTLLIGLVAGLAQFATAQVTYLTNQHMDFRLQYDATATGSNRLDLILGYDPGQRASSSAARAASRSWKAPVSNPSVVMMTASSPLSW